MALPTFTIAHFVFLNREQRYELNKPETEIEVIGTYSFVVMSKYEHKNLARETFAKYRIRHSSQPEKHTITPYLEGFNILLSPNMPIYLKDVKDGGSKCLILNHKNVLELNNKKYSVMHYLTVEDLQILENSLC